MAARFWTIPILMVMSGCNCERRELLGLPVPEDAGGQVGVGAGSDGGNPPGASACDTLPRIELVNGTASLDGQTTGRADSLAGSCGGATVSDIGYALRLPSAGTLVATVRAMSPDFQPVVYLQRGCGVQRLEVQNGCAIANRPGTTTALVVHDLLAGDYELWVDGAPGGAGAFQLSVSLLPTQAGDTCATAIPLSFSGDELTVFGTTDALGNDEDGCTTFTQAPDVYFSVELAETTNVAVSIASQKKTYPPWYPVVSLREACGGKASGDGIGDCSGALYRTSVPAQTHFLWVDSWESFQSGPYKLVLTTIPLSTGNDCASARPVPFDPAIGGSFQDTVEPHTLGNDFTSVCTHNSFNENVDAVYRFTTTARLNLWVNAYGATFAVEPRVALGRGTCGGLGTVVGCADRQNAFGDLDPGTYEVWLDGLGSNDGPVTMELLAAPVVAGDTCNNAVPLTFSNGVIGGQATVSDSTVGLFHDKDGSCGSYGPDRVYTFTTSAVMDFGASLDASFAGAVYLRAGNCTTGGELACDSDGAGGTSELDVHALQPGTYFLWVDSGSHDASGSYTLSATLAAPAEGDMCADPVALSFTGGTSGGQASIAGDSSNLYHDAQGSCGGSTGADVVYAFTTSRVLDLRAQVTTTNLAFQPLLYIREGACGGVELACQAASGAGTPAQLALDALPPGSYFLWLDGLDGSAGDYALDVSLLEPGDTCANLVALDVSGGSASVAGDLSTFQPNVAGSCGGAAGADAVYAFTTTASHHITASVSAPSGSPLRPAVYLKRGSCTGADIGCAAACAGCSTATVLAPSQPAGTYYLVVDSADGSTGPYTVSVTLN